MNPVTKKLLMTFTSIVSVIVVTFCIIGSIFFFVFAKDVTYVSPEPTIDIYATDEDFQRQREEARPTELQRQGGLLDDLFTAPTRTNFLILGIDAEASLADAIMVGCFNSETLQLDLISIPRDTWIRMPQTRVRQLQSLGRSVPSSGEMKINETHSYPGRDLGTEFTKLQVEELLGIDIDFYIEVSLSAFRKIVDDIGGVTMTIPQGGLYWEDPYINLPGGTYNLSGAQAEGLVRFRNYPTADLKRMDVQQEFLKEFMRKMLTRETLFQNAPALITTFLSYVKTDFKITDLPKYLEYLSQVSIENLHMTTLPGTAPNVFHHDPVATAELVQRIFFDPVRPQEPEPEPQPSNTAPNPTPTREEPTPEPEPVRTAKDLRVQVLNGSGTSGIAARRGANLQNLGYNLVDIGNYDGTRTNHTRVVVRKNEDATAFTPFFSNARVVLDENLPEDYDVVIILGTNER